MISLASSRATFLPALLNTYAVVNPVIPPPTTQTSTSKFSSKVGYFSNVTESSQYDCASSGKDVFFRSEEHTSELQSRFDLVCRLLLEIKKYTTHSAISC